MFCNASVNPYIVKKKYMRLILIVETCMWNLYLVLVCMHKTYLSHCLGKLKIWHCRASKPKISPVHSHRADQGLRCSFRSCSFRRSKWYEYQEWRTSWLRRLSWTFAMACSRRDHLLAQAHFILPSFLFQNLWRDAMKWYLIHVCR